MGAAWASPAAASPRFSLRAQAQKGLSCPPLLSRLFLPVRSPLVRPLAPLVPWPRPLASSARFGLPLPLSPCPSLLPLMPPPLRAGLVSACFPPVRSASASGSPPWSLPVPLSVSRAGSPQPGLAPLRGGFFFGGHLCDLVSHAGPEVQTKHRARTRSRASLTVSTVASFRFHLS